MFTRKTIKLPVLPSAIPETVSSESWKAEVEQLRRQVNALRKAHYDSMRAVDDFLRSLNNKGVLAIGEATGSFTTLEVTTSSTFPTTSTTPVPTAGSGTFTTVASSLATTKVGNRVLLDLTVTITTNGTAAGHVAVATGFTPAVATALCATNSATGVVLSANISASGTIFIFTAAGAYPGGDGVVLRVGGNFRV
jgi:hypothetical protein